MGGGGGVVGQRPRPAPHMGDKLVYVLAETCRGFTSKIKNVYATNATVVKYPQ